MGLDLRGRDRSADALNNGGQNEGDIVLPARDFSHLNQRVRFPVKIGIRVEDLPDLIILNHVGQAVRTEEVHIL